MAKTDIESRINEYYERTLRLNSLISADQDILKRIMSAVNHQYDGKELDNNVVILGEGKANKLYNVGSVVNPKNQLEIPIAIRLNIMTLYLKSSHLLNELEKEVKEYEAAYALGENTPYFISVVTFPYEKLAPGLEACAILTEDVSKKRTLTLKELDRSRFERTNEDGSKQTFFLDPNNFVELDNSYSGTYKVKQACDGNKYLKDKARIDLNVAAKIQMPPGLGGMGM